MPLTMQHLHHLLSQCGVTIVATTRGCLVVAMKGRQTPFLITAESRENGTLLQLRTQSLAHARHPMYRSTVLSALLSANWKYKLVKFALDPGDGEIIGYVDVLLRGADLTVRQLGACLEALHQLGLRMQRRIERIAATGADPGDRDADIARDLLAGAALMMLIEAAQRSAASPAAPTAAPPPRTPPPRPPPARLPAAPNAAPGTQSKPAPNGSPEPARPAGASPRPMTRTDFDRFVDDVLKDD